MWRVADWYSLEISLSSSLCNVVSLIMLIIIIVIFSFNSSPSCGKIYIETWQNETNIPVHYGQPNNTCYKHRQTHNYSLCPVLVGTWMARVMALVGTMLAKNLPPLPQGYCRTRAPARHSFHSSTSGCATTLLSFSGRVLTKCIIFSITVTSVLTVPRCIIMILSILFLIFFLAVLLRVYTWY